MISSLGDLLFQVKWHEKSMLNVPDPTELFLVIGSPVPTDLKQRSVLKHNDTQSVHPPFRIPLRKFIWVGVLQPS